MNLTHFQLRPIQQGDNPRVAHIIRNVMTEFGTVGEGYSINDPEVDLMYESYQAPDAAFFVIEGNDGQVYGCGGIGPLKGGEQEVCELKKMYFLPELRRKGFGKTMVEQCLEAARKAGFRYCYLETVERMWQANLLYQKMGFQKLNGPRGNTGHNSCELWYMRAL
jgi:putative acetyltransferase